VLEVFHYLGEVIAHGLLDVPGHGLGQHGVNRGLRQRAQAPGDGGDLCDVRAPEHAVPQVGGEHLSDHRGREVTAAGLIGGPARIIWRRAGLIGPG
jgi:hypothetical protein